jgi:hypothetical protein
MACRLEAADLLLFFAAATDYASIGSTLPKGESESWLRKVVVATWTL